MVFYVIWLTLMAIWLWRRQTKTHGMLLMLNFLFRQYISWNYKCIINLIHGPNEAVLLLSAINRYEWCGRIDNWKWMWVHLLSLCSVGHLVYQSRVRLKFWAFLQFIIVSYIPLYIVISYPYGVSATQSLLYYQSVISYQMSQ